MESTLSQFVESGLRQIVLDGKPKLDHDCGLADGHNCLMAAQQALTTVKLQFLARTKAAREARGFNQDKMAGLLEDGMKQPKYAKYETRTPLPHHLIPRFVELSVVDYEWWFTGKGKGPAWRPYFDELLAKHQAAGKRRRRKAA